VAVSADKMAPTLEAVVGKFKTIRAKCSNLTPFDYQKFGGLLASFGGN